MASISVQAANATFMDPSFIMTAAIVVAGSLASQLLTNYLKNNVRDLQIRGGDALYAAVAAYIMRLVLPKRFGKPLALGASATSIRVLASDYNVI